MFRLETVNKPRGRLVRAGSDSDAFCVRVYRNSPSDLILQLWSGKRYMLVVLEQAEARAIAQELLTVSDTVETLCEGGK